MRVCPYRLRRNSASDHFLKMLIAIVINRRLNSSCYTMHKLGPLLSTVALQASEECSHRWMAKLEQCLKPMMPTFNDVCCSRDSITGSIALIPQVRRKEYRCHETT